MFHLATQHSLDASVAISPSEIQQQLKQKFISIWDEERWSNRKLVFYNSIKKVFAIENYLTEGLKHKELVSMARIRTSAHKLRVETGRYGINRGSQAKRACPTCTDLENADYLCELPYYDPIIEDETHILLTCPSYHDLRSRLDENLKTNLFADISTAFQQTKEIARFVKRIMVRRFPRNEEKKKKRKDCSNTKSPDTSDLNQKTEDNFSKL